MAKIDARLQVDDDETRTSTIRTAEATGRTLREAFDKVWIALQTEGEFEVFFKRSFNEFDWEHRTGPRFRFSSDTEWVDTRLHRIQSGLHGDADTVEEARERASRFVAPSDERPFEPTLAEVVSRVKHQQEELTELLELDTLERPERNKIVQARLLLADIINDIVGRDGDLVVVGSEEATK